MINIFEQRSRVKMSEYQAPELIVAGVYDWFFNAEDLVEVDWIRNILIRFGENETKVDKYIETFVYKQKKICCCTKMQQMQQMTGFLDEHAKCFEPYIIDAQNSEEHNVDTVVEDADCSDDCHDDGNSDTLPSITTTNVEIDTTPIDTNEKSCDKIDASSDKIDASSDKIDASSDKINSSCDTNETSCNKIDDTEDEFGNESDDEASNESEARLDEDEVPLLGNDSDTTYDEPNSDCCNFYD